MSSIKSNFIHKPFPPPVFDRLHFRYANTEGEGLVIRGTHDVTGSKHEDMFTIMYISSYREARQVPAERQVLYLYNMTESEAEPL